MYFHTCQQFRLATAVCRCRTQLIYALALRQRNCRDLSVRATSKLQATITNKAHLHTPLLLCKALIDQRKFVFCCSQATSLPRLSSGVQTVADPLQMAVVAFPMQEADGEMRYQPPCSISFGAETRASDGGGGLVNNLRYCLGLDNRRGVVVVELCVF